MGTRQVGSTRLLAIFGSGETTSGMTSVHQDLIRRAGGTRTNGIMLDTPFGFQENADEIAARAVAYFRDHVGSDIRVASFRRGTNGLGYERFIDEISRAAYIFAGPGSPTYALKLWRDGEIRRRLAEKLVFGGCLAFSSAAAAGLGAYAIPVYEIYKVGEDPFWVDGLDLLGELGIRCVVVPHFNNSEGGTHDTRFCYIGENRLRLLESQLPEDISILGVDEHTVCIIDADHGTVTVRGRGALTLRQRGTERRWRATSLPLSEIQHGLAAEGAVGESGSSKRACVDRNDAEAELAPDAGDVRERLAPLVDMLLDLRNEARNQRRFDEADRLRAVLSASGVEVQDSPTGTAWSLAQA